MSDGPESSSEHHGLHHTATHALPHEQKLARQRRHLQILTVVCVLVLAGTGGFAYLRSKTAHLLRLDAIAVASEWSHYLVRTTPEFLLILAGELPPALEPFTAERFHVPPA